MELSPSERAILERYAEKTRIAGGAKPGYLLRVGALRVLAEEREGIDLDAGLAGLVEKELLQDAPGERYYLTEAGVEMIESGSVTATVAGQ